MISDICIGTRHSANHSKIPARVHWDVPFEIFPERSDAEKFHQDDLELMRTGSGWRCRKPM